MSALFSIPICLLIVLAVAHAGWRRALTSPPAMTPVGAITLLGALAGIIITLLGAPPDGSWTDPPGRNLTMPLSLAVSLPLAVGLAWTGGVLARRGWVTHVDSLGWVLAAAVLGVVVMAGRLPLLDGQLLALAGLSLVWWRSVSSPASFGSPVGRPAFAVLLACTLSLGLLSVARMTRMLWDAVGHLPGRMGQHSPGEILAVVVETTLSVPALDDASPLRLTAWTACAAAVALVWTSAVQASTPSRAARSTGVVLVLLGGLLAVSGLPG